ncbi:centromere protein I-like [Bombyx mandarina]|uniref:Centromere protein I-like n=1 Tax=Bombyx mandarina TaxID=7092 RepID=A0A6J2JXM2_BOMMA|nr:centromere protein I-like [Bombyx mandarina]
MCDIGEIIDYIKSLKRGFDKDLFQSKIDELGYIVDSVGLDYDDFHTLFKIWLNLSIPLTKWTSLGACLIPPDAVEEKTVDYAIQWILINYGNQNSFTKTGFLLDWLTAAMECDCIDMKALDFGYELFYSMMTYETLTPQAVKLVYTLTKPSDVTRRRVIEILDCAKKRESKKNLFRQLQILLGLFKSYKPECVPENVPAICVHTAFKKINKDLLGRFKRTQERRNRQSKEKQHLIWLNPINMARGRNKKVVPLVPNMEFFNIGSKQYDQKEPQKNYLDFSDPASVVQLAACGRAARPARLRALLCGPALLLAAAAADQHAFLSHDLRHLLDNCFLDVSPYSYAEKQDLLQRLALLQSTLLQGIPVITRFLAQFLPLWNERDYFTEILQLVEWVSVDSPDHLGYIVGPLIKIYHRAQPLEQCAILKSLTQMYINLVYASTRRRQYFMAADTPKENYGVVLPRLAAELGEMGEKALQYNPDDMRVLFSNIWSVECRSRAHLLYNIGLGPIPGLLSLSLPLLGVSAALIEKMAALLVIYKKIFTRLKSTNAISATHTEQIQILHRYSVDLSSLYTEESLRGRGNGFVFDKLHPQLVSKLYHLIPEPDTKLSVRSHVAFAAYTYVALGDDERDADNKAWYRAFLEHEFSYLAKFFKKTVPELRM